MKRANAFAVGGVVVVVVIIALVAIGLAVREYGGETYKGKRPAEWRRMADDLDADMRVEGYAGLAATGQVDELCRRFDRENQIGPKLFIAKTIVHVPDMRPKIVAFLAGVLKDRNFGDIYFSDPNFTSVIESLARMGETGPLEPLIQYWTNNGISRAQANDVLNRIAASKPKTSP